VPIYRRVGKRGNVKYVVRYYDAAGRQRKEVVGPNRKDALAVDHQRAYEARMGIHPILRKRQRMTFADFSGEWKTKHLVGVRVRASTAGHYRSVLTHQLLPEFGAKALSEITAESVQNWIAKMSGRLKPKTLNHGLGLLKMMLAAAVEWGYLPASPAARARKLKVPRRDMIIWTPAELRKFLLAAPEPWRSVWIVAVFTGLRPEELQPMSWTDRNWPDFIANKIHVNCGYEAKSKVLGPPKTDESIRDVDMVPTVRQVLEALPGRDAGGLIFPRADGRMFSRFAMETAWARTIKAAQVRRIRPYDLRHTYASLMIAAGKNVLYVSRQMGHHSPGFTLNVYGHLMESVPRRQVDWIDAIVFPEGWKRGLNWTCRALHRVQRRAVLFYRQTARKPCRTPLPAASCHPMQIGAWWGGKDSNLRRHSAS